MTFENFRDILQKMLDEKLHDKAAAEELQNLKDADESHTWAFKCGFVKACEMFSNEFLNEVQAQIADMEFRLTDKGKKALEEAGQ